MKWIFHKDRIGRLQEDSEFPLGAFFLPIESPSLISLGNTLGLHGKGGKAILNLTGGLSMSIFWI